MSSAIPEVRGDRPLVGHLGSFLRDPVGLLRRAHAECGDVAAFRLGPRRVVLLNGLAQHEAFFRAPDEQLSQRDAYQLMIPVFGPGVVYDAPPVRMIEQFHFLIPMGTAFAMLQLRIIVGAMLSSYELGVTGDRIEDDYGVLVIGPKSPLRLKYRRRRSRARSSFAIEPGSSDPTAELTLGAGG